MVFLRPIQSDCPTARLKIVQYPLQLMNAKIKALHSVKSFRVSKIGDITFGAALILAGLKI